MWQNDNENIEVVVPEDELEHHGTKGMKWGQRRYQNPDGSLTPAGEKRYLKGGGKDGSKVKIPKKKKLKDMSADELRKEVIRKNLAEEYNELKGKTGLAGLLQKKATSKMSTSQLQKEIEREKLLKQLKDDNKKEDPKTEEKKKSYKDMTDEELRSETARMQIEKQYKDAEKQLKEASKTELRKFGEKAVRTAGDAALEAGKDVTKQFLVKWGKKVLDIDQPDKELKDLQRQEEISRLKERITKNDVSKVTRAAETRVRIDSLQEALKSQDPTTKAKAQKVANELSKYANNPDEKAKLRAQALLEAWYKQNKP